MLDKEATHDNFKSMNHSVWMLAWPAMVEFGLQTVVQYADLLMVGRLGNQATAIVGMAAQLSFFIKFPISSISIGVLVAISKAAGEKKSKLVKTVSMQTVYLSIAIGLFATIGTLGILPFLLAFFRIEHEIQLEFIQYYCVVYSTLFLFTAGVMFSAVLRGIGDMKTPMVVNGFINVMNIFLNALFIYPKRVIAIPNGSIQIPGFNLGILGSALATSVSIGAGGLLMVWKVYQNPIVTMRNAEWKPNRSILTEIMKVGTPAAMSSLVNGFGRLIFTSYVSGMGVAAIAAHSIAFTIEGFFYIPAVGFERAVSVLAGYFVGEKNKKKFIASERSTLFLCAIVMSVLGILLFYYAPMLTAEFTTDPSVAAWSGKLLRIVAFSEPIFAVSLVMEGVFQGMGNTRTPFLVTTISMWSIRVVLCYILTQQFSMGLEIVWVCMVADNICRAIVLILVFLRRKWESFFF